MQKNKNKKQLKDIIISQQQISWQASREETKHKDIVHVQKDLNLKTYKILKESKSKLFNQII